jgi:hypothetical protein
MLLDRHGVVLRNIVVREPRIGESDGTRHAISGDGHDYSVHDSLDVAEREGEASLSPEQLARLPP